MDLNKGQQEALKIVVERYRNNQRYAIISGNAGTGKSFLVKAIIDSLDEIDPVKDVVYTAYTGKACEVLKKKGNDNTSTLHKLLYYSHLQPDGRYIRKKVEGIPYKIVVVDECSMVPPEMVEQLASYIFCIFLGDNGQLPPVKAENNNGLLSRPHATLTQIMRQEEGGEIVEIATKIRLGEDVPYMKGENVMVLPPNSLTDGMLLWADIILCSTNKKRQEINQRIRMLKGYDEPIVTGEKLICLKNDWDKFSLPNGSPLMNGQICSITSDISEFKGVIPKGARVKGEIPFYKFDIITDVGEEFLNIKADKSILLTEKSCLTSQQIYNIMRSQYQFILPNEFTYGYAITCHKAQGSEFSKVLVLEEKFPFDKQEHTRWLYTAFTRASDRVVWIKC